MKSSTNKTHAERCESQGHEWENCCSITFEIYQCCQWCGIKRGITPKHIGRDYSPTLTLKQNRKP